MPTWNYHFAGLIAGMFSIFILDASIVEAIALDFIITMQLMISRMLYAEKRKKEEGQ